jgi:hypothetical protein
MNPASWASRGLDSAHLAQTGMTGRARSSKVSARLAKRVFG